MKRQREETDRVREKTREGEKIEKRREKRKIKTENTEKRGEGTDEEPKIVSGQTNRPKEIETQNANNTKEGRIRDTRFFLSKSHVYKNVEAQIS
jgi:Ca2+-dependent lipid-binding protein